MATLKFEKARLQQVKCFTDNTFDLYPRTDVIGKNGSGKTSLGTALKRPFVNYDLNGKSNPELYPDHLQEPESHITINGKLDDNPITVEFIMKDDSAKSKSGKDIGKSKNTKYRMNGIDTTRSGFEKEMFRQGIDTDLYETLTNPYHFLNMKTEDKRKSIFNLVDEITDSAVAESLGDEASILIEKFNENYTLTQIEDDAKKSRKASSDLQDSIPSKINGLESAKQEVDVSGLTTRKQELEASIADIQSEFNKIQNVSKASIEQIIKSKRMDLTLAVNKANDARDSKIRSAKSELVKAADEVNTLQFQISHQEAQIQRMQNTIDDRTERMNRQIAEYNVLKAETFPGGKSFCEKCGQKLPQDKIALIRAKWEKDTNESIEAKRQDGNALFLEIKQFKKELESARAELQNAKDCLEKQKEQLAIKEKAVDLLLAEPDVMAEDLPEYESIQKEIASLELQFGDIDKIEADRARKLSDINQLRIELIGVEKELAKTSFNDDIDKKIAELEKTQREVAQNIADADRILYQVQILKKKKCAMLSESINSKFPEFIRFKLFEPKVTKDGENEYKDVCIPEIRNENGEWKELGRTANQALEMRGMLAILNTFQNFHNMHVPIIIDGASELDSESKKLINLDTQVIFLSVRDDADLTVTSI